MLTVVFSDAVLRCLPHGSGAAAGLLDGKPQAGATSDARDADRGELPEPEHQPPSPDHVVYPYLLRGLAIDRPNQVWCADITYIPLAKGFVYLVAVGAADAFRHIDPLRGPMDWFSRRVLAWCLSTGMDTEFCVEALQEALDRHGSPEIFNSNQGCSSPVPRSPARWRPAVCASAWMAKAVTPTTSSSSGYGAAWSTRTCTSRPTPRSLKRAVAIGGWLSLYNDKRLHQALGYRTPCDVFGARPVTYGYVDNACALTTPPQAQRQQQGRDSIELEKKR